MNGYGQYNPVTAEDDSFAGFEFAIGKSVQVEAFVVENPSDAKFVLVYNRGQPATFAIADIWTGSVPAVVEACRPLLERDGWLLQIDGPPAPMPYENGTVASQGLRQIAGLALELISRSMLEEAGSADPCWRSNGAGNDLSLVCFADRGARAYGVFSAHRFVLLENSIFIDRPEENLLTACRDSLLLGHCESIEDEFEQLTTEKLAEGETPLLLNADFEFDNPVEALRWLTGDVSRCLADWQIVLTGQPMTEERLTHALTWQTNPAQSTPQL